MLEILQGICGEKERGRELMRVVFFAYIHFVVDLMVLASSMACTRGSFVVLACLFEANQLAWPVILVKLYGFKDAINMCSLIQNFKLNLQWCRICFSEGSCKQSISDYGFYMSLREGFYYKPLFFLKSVLPPLHSRVQSSLSLLSSKGCWCTSQLASIFLHLRR